MRTREIIAAKWLELQHPKIVQPALYLETCGYGWGAEIWNVGITIKLCIAIGEVALEYGVVSSLFFLVDNFQNLENMRGPAPYIYPRLIRGYKPCSWLVPCPILERGEVQTRWYDHKRSGPVKGGEGMLLGAWIESIEKQKENLVKNNFYKLQWLIISETMVTRRNKRQLEPKTYMKEEKMQLPDR